MHRTPPTEQVGSRFLRINPFKLLPKNQSLSPVRSHFKSYAIRHMELAHFRKHLQKSLTHSLSLKRFARKVKRYRSTFFALALLFLLLIGVVLTQNLSISTLLLGDLRGLIKPAIISMALIMSATAAFAGYSLCIASEAANTLASKARHKINRIYARKRLENGVRWISYGEINNKKHSNLNSFYQESMDAVEEKREETAELLRQILKAEVTADRDLLFSQALSHMQDELHQTIEKFQEFNP